MNVAKITAELTHLDEAVMEMQPDQRRCHPGLPGDGPRHDGPHDLLDPGARVVVELREQAAPRVPAGGAGEEERGDDEAGEQDEATAHWRSRHGKAVPIDAGV